MIAPSPSVKIHFIGIGGIGMSGIAEVLLSMGFSVSGSDVVESANTLKLSEMGADIIYTHSSLNLKDADVVVFSSAISEKNPEMIEAKKRELPLMRRAEMIAELMRLKSGVAIGGTHGKTTTTSFLATILTEAQFDPTYIIGGIVNNLNGHARVGKGRFLVAEADESDGSFLLLNPIYSVITNIDDDHLDYYGNEKSVDDAFVTFANKIPFYGVCAMNAHDKRVGQIRQKMKKPSISFGIDDGSLDFTPDVLAKNVNYSLEKTTFELWSESIKECQLEINLPGRHNVLNCLGAVSIALQLGVTCQQIAQGVANFKGVGRRFQTLHKSDDFILVDDYGHHPTEIEVTLQTLQQTAKDHKIIAIFEPHRYTRTRDCWNDFLHCFNHADQVYLGPIYPASEEMIPGIDSVRLSKDINKLHPALSCPMDSIDELGDVIKKYLDQKAIVITLGAGSIGKKVRTWIKESS